MSQQQLAYNITKASNSSVWETAKEEWKLSSIYEASEPETCTCGHTPIKECCIIHNVINNNKMMVGNCCVKKFMGLPSDLIFQAVKRVRKDCTKSLNVEALTYAQGKGWINDWEFTFYINVMSKRKMSEKQALKKKQVNTLFLQRMQSPTAQKLSIKLF